MTPLSLAAEALTGLAAVMVAATLLWLVSLRKRDASIADPFWAPGFLLLAVVYAAVGSGWGGGGGSTGVPTDDGGPTGLGPRGWVVLLLVAAWALRLGIYLLGRNRREGEDRRYRAMRERHGDAFGRVSLFTVFWLQAVLLWVVAMPLLAALAGPPGWTWLDAVGAAVAAAGVVMEAVADGQLRRFRADPANQGRVMDRGLWRYSRHPNYFANAVLWWGLYLLAVSAGGWWTAVGPALMTFLLVRVSGVRLLESDMAQRRPEYADYVRRTPAFVPWKPRSSGGGGR